MNKKILKPMLSNTVAEEKRLDKKGRFIAYQLGAVSLMNYLARYSQIGVNQVWNGIHFALVISKHH